MQKLYFKSFIIAFIVFIFGVNSLSNVDAISKNNPSNSDNQVVYVNGSHYNVSVDHKGINTISSVTDEKGTTTMAIFDKETNKLTINGNEIQIEEYKNSITSFSRASNKVLKRKTYTIPGSATSTAAALIAGLAAISNFPFAAAVVSAFISGNLWGKSIKIIITDYRSGSRYKSGSHKGKYKYWTNVLVKCGSATILNQNHSVCYK